MQASHTQGQETTTTTPIHTPFTLFKPRQLLLLNNSNSNYTMINSTKTPFSLTNQQSLLLFHSICHFFDQNGFSKSLKKFTKEAHVEKESWKSCVLNLEEMCYQFLKMQNDPKVGESAIKEQATSQKDESNHVEPVETIEKTKKYKGDEGKKSQEKVEDIPIVDVKPKKKKNKSASESTEQIAEENHMKPSNEPEKKSKDKKKKHKEESLEEKKEETVVELSKQADVSEDKKKEKSKSKKKKENDLKIEDSSVEDKEVDNEKKSSKKRKKSSSEENENGDVEKQLVGDSKRRKTDDFDQSNETVAPKTPNGSSNGILENGERKESQKKEKSKQRNGSAETKSAANAFRRVKEEEVEFVDERLQDNSYWAKDGAEIGYGAKAQEVLGQVRGRGFRHEKTKKKRGSYRGGQIDLDSHSIKFNYDDDDE